MDKKELKKETPKFHSNPRIDTPWSSIYRILGFCLRKTNVRLQSLVSRQSQKLCKNVQKLLELLQLLFDFLFPDQYYKKKNIMSVISTVFYGDYDRHYWKSLLGLNLSIREYWNLGFRSAFPKTKAIYHKGIKLFLIC
jgi:hypothetical protein